MSPAWVLPTAAPSSSCPQGLSRDVANTSVEYAAWGGEHYDPDIKLLARKFRVSKQSLTPDAQAWFKQSVVVLYPGRRACMSLDVSRDGVCPATLRIPDAHATAFAGYMMGFAGERQFARNRTVSPALSPANTDLVSREAMGVRARGRSK